MKKVAVVTGGARGIGLAITRILIEKGYAVCVLGQRDVSQLSDEFQALMNAGEILYYQGSIANEAQRRSFVDEISNRYQRVDVLVNNAGIAPRVRMDMLETTEESFDEVLNVNLKGTMFMTQMISRKMISQPKAEGDIQGVIVNISSFSAWVSSPNRAEYCVSKAGISMLTKLYADRLAKNGILVYEVQPGVIRTDMTSGVTEKYDKLLHDGQFPLERWGTPEDVAKAVACLAEGSLPYSTGQVLHVDGGYANVRSI